MHYKEVKGILSVKNGMNLCGMNLFRGCIHGCIYCDSRSKCYQMTHDFEDIEIKSNAAMLLEKILSAKRKKCMICTGAMTDSYMPLKETLAKTRESLEIIEKYGFGVSIQTKSDLILRDIDILERINRKAKCVVQITLTTLDDNLCRIIEPNVSVTSRRFEVLMEMRKRNIPTVVWICPLLPFINDTSENLEGILEYCLQAEVKGILYYGAGVTLREGNREYFYKKLDESFPKIKQKYIKAFGNSYICASPNAKELDNAFYAFCKSHNIMSGNKNIFNYLNTLDENKNVQLEFFM